jgi:phospholipase C
MFKQLLSILGIGALSLVASSCGGGSGTTSNLQQPPGNRVPRSGIQHLIIVVMQNASFDHLFGTYSGVNGLDPTAPSYKQVDATGNTVQPALLTNLSPADLNHTRTSYLSAYD